MFPLYGESHVRMCSISDLLGKARRGAEEVSFPSTQFDLPTANERLGMDQLALT